jgi:hypothetical protein
MILTRIHAPITRGPRGIRALPRHSGPLTDRERLVTYRSIVRLRAAIAAGLYDSQSVLDVVLEGLWQDIQERRHDHRGDVSA